MEINIDKMLEKQAQRLREINNEEPIKEESIDVIYYNIEDLKTITHTELINVNNVIRLTRLLNDYNKMVVVDVPPTINIKELYVYMQITDGEFYKIRSNLRN